MQLLIACFAATVAMAMTSTVQTTIKRLVTGLNSFGGSVEQRQPRIVVIGSGLAGTTSALTAAAHMSKAQVIQLEKNPKPGGNSMKASSGMSVLSLEEGDKPEDFEDDIKASGGGRSRPELVHTLVLDSPQALNFLKECGVQLGRATQLGGHSHKRTVGADPKGPNVGFVIMQALGAQRTKHPNLQLVLNATVGEVRVQPHWAIHHASTYLPMSPYFYLAR